MWVNNKLEQIENTAIQVHESLQSVRPRKKSKQFMYESADHPINDPLHSFTVNVHNVIFDSVIQSIAIHFEKHKHLYSDFNCLDPNNFCINESLPKDALKSIHLKILPFIPDLSHEELCHEYNDFVSKWSILKKNCITDQYKNKNDIEVFSGEEDDGMHLYSKYIYIYFLCVYFYCLQN